MSLLSLAEWRDRLAYQPISLSIVALLTSGALVLANQLTHPSILKAEAVDLQNSLAEVLPSGFADNDLLKDTVRLTDEDGKPVIIYRARQAGAIKGALFQTSARGYAGEVVVLIAVDISGTMIGARVVKHQETPGLGDKVDAAKSDWIHAFEGISLTSPPAEKWAVKKDGGVFDQFAGATITPRAVVKAVKHGMQFYASHRDEILSAKTE